MSDCGTAHGRNKHLRAGEPMCDPCRDAYAAYMRDRRQRLTVGRAYTFPTEVRFDDFDGLGATIARSFRESA